MENKNVRKAVLVAIVLVVGGTLGIGNGCSRQYISNSADFLGQSSLAPPAAVAGGVTDIEVLPGARTVSLVYSKQVLDQLSSCAGLASPSDRTIAMYEQKQGAVSTYGYANTVTSPMMMAVTSIAGEICNDLVAQELVAGPRLFVGYNLAAAVVPNSSQLADSISRIALSCWQRNENSSERQVLLDMVNSSVMENETMASRKSALMICTAMLSSLDALLN